MQGLKNLNAIIEDHANRKSIFMEAGSVVNFIDHISPSGDNCAECRNAIRKYTNDEITVLVTEGLL